MAGKSMGLAKTSVKREIYANSQQNRMVKGLSRESTVPVLHEADLGSVPKL